MAPVLRQKEDDEDVEYVNWILRTTRCGHIRLGE